jgi:5-methylcytosine-specific restriction endonuclease McrA
MRQITITHKEVEIQKDDLKRECSQCGGNKFSIELNGPHAQQKCENCEEHLGFVKQKHNSKTAKRDHSVSDVIDYRGFSKEFCFNCTRTRQQLGNKETLEVDHIKELEDGGEDRPKNLRVLCTKCHKQRNHDKLYVKEHLSKFYPEGEEV